MSATKRSMSSGMLKREFYESELVTVWCGAVRCIALYVEKEDEAVCSRLFTASVVLSVQPFSIVHLQTLTTSHWRVTIGVR